MSGVDYRTQRLVQALSRLGEAAHLAAAEIHCDPRNPGRVTAALRMRLDTCQEATELLAAVLHASQRNDYMEAL